MGQKPILSVIVWESSEDGIPIGSEVVITETNWLKMIKQEDTFMPVWPKP